MSHPSLLEYSLSPSYPFSGWLSKRFSISGEVWVCPTLPVLRLEAFFGFFIRRFDGYCTMFIQEFVTLLSFLFSSLLSGNRNIFPSRAKFVGLMLAVFQPVTHLLF
jgi:hypothetical protein